MLDGIDTTEATEVDIEVDYPWLTVARVIYPHMIRVDIRYNQNCDPDELNMMRDRFVQADAVSEWDAVTSDPDDFILVDSVMETERHYWFMDASAELSML